MLERPNAPPRGRRFVRPGICFGTDQTCAYLSLQTQMLYRQWFRTAQVYSISFKAARKYLPPLFPCVVAAGTEHRALQHPSLFELAISATLPETACKSSEMFKTDPRLPNPPNPDDYTHLASLRKLIRGAFSMELEMPLTFSDNDPPRVIEELTAVLSNFVSSCLDTLESSEVVTNGRLNSSGRRLCEMVRALGGLRGLSVSSPIAPDPLHDRCYNALASLCIQRYSAFVLLPIARSISANHGKLRGPAVRALVKALNLAVNSWVSHTNANLARLLQVRSSVSNSRTNDDGIADPCEHHGKSFSWVQYLT